MPRQVFGDLAAQITSLFAGLIVGKYHQTGRIAGPGQCGSGPKGLADFFSPLSNCSNHGKNPFADRSQFCGMRITFFESSMDLREAPNAKFVPIIDRDSGAITAHKMAQKLTDRCGNRDGDGMMVVSRPLWNAPERIGNAKARSAAWTNENNLSAQ